VVEEKTEEAEEMNATDKRNKKDWPENNFRPALQILLNPI
jgi:hypothetical protein